MTRAPAVHRALVTAAPGVRRVAGERWTFAITNGTTTLASATLDGDWLVVRAEPSMPGGSRLPSAWSMLAWNAELAGGACFAAGTTAPALRADVPLDTGADLATRLSHVCRGFRDAITCLHERDTWASVSETVVDDDGALALLCRETGWSTKEREPGRLAVDLDVPGRFQQALVEHWTGHRVSVSVPVLDATVGSREPATAACRQALGVFLLRMCGTVRMVRAAVAGDASAAPRFEVVHDRPTRLELEHGFAALSIACRLAVREAAVLWHDDVVAGAYLRQFEDAAARRAA